MDNHKTDRISFSELKLALHERGFGVLMLIFALPISLPLPLPPGLTSLPAIPLLIFSIQMLMGMIGASISAFVVILGEEAIFSLAHHHSSWFYTNSTSKQH